MNVLHNSQDHQAYDPFETPTEIPPKIDPHFFKLEKTSKTFNHFKPFI